MVGLYLDPPQAAVVFCVHEKSQIQAIDRTQPAFPILPGTPARRSHDYIRDGTTSLFAALEVATGKVIGQTHGRHRNEEFRRFLNVVDREVPEHLDVHLILDNSSTHKTDEVQRWQLRHPRFYFHFIPTHSSWLNLVEVIYEGPAVVKRGDHELVGVRGGARIPPLRPLRRRNRRGGTAVKGAQRPGGMAGGHP